MTQNPIVAYWIESHGAPFSAIVFSDSPENALKAGEQGFEAIWGTIDRIKATRAPKYDAKYVPGMKVNECLDPFVVAQTW
jgi:hypothetical protein